MRRLFLLITFFTFSIIGANAQSITEATETEKKLAKINVEGWQSKLILNVKQKEKMLVVVTLYEMGKNAIYKGDSEMDIKNKELEALEKSYYVKIGELLSEEQFAEFNAQIASIKSGS